MDICISDKPAGDVQALSAQKAIFRPERLRHIGAIVDLNIRKAELSDAALIADFNRRLAQETEALTLDAECLLKGVTALLRDPGKGLYYVAEVEGMVVGQVMITYEWSDWRNGNLWWLQSVYVREESRGQGVFRALFRHVEDLARKDPNVAGVRLYMHEENARARRAYEALGMKQTKYQVFELDLRAEG